MKNASTEANPAITWIEGVKFGKDDLSRLMRNGGKAAWQNDTTISLVSILLNRHYGERKVVCFNSFLVIKITKVAGHISNPCKETAMSWIRKQLRLLGGLGLDGIEADKLLIPFNSNNSHWILFVVDLTQRTAYAVDPYTPNKASKENVRITNEIVKLLLSMPDLKLKKKGIKVQERNKLTLPSQHDGYNCGVFVCLYMALIVFDTFPHLTTEAVPKYRAFIAYWILHKFLPPDHDFS